MAIPRQDSARSSDDERLAEELRRAAQILDLCRGKIRRAEIEVTQIVQSLEQEEDGNEE